MKIREAIIGKKYILKPLTQFGINTDFIDSKVEFLRKNSVDFEMKYEHINGNKGICCVTPMDSYWEIVPFNEDWDN